MKLKALEARLWAHCEGILHDVWDPNTSRGQLRVQFENLFSVRDQVVLDALEARREEHCEGLRQDVFDANISGQQLRVKFEELLSVQGQLFQVQRRCWRDRRTRRATSTLGARRAGG